MFRWLRDKFQKPADHSNLQSVTVTEKERWERLESVLGFRLQNLKHYKRALRHRSIIDSEQYEKHETYERLEFLGDAVLDLIVTEIIFEKFPEEDEGFMTKLRAKLVKGDTLARLAKSLQLHTILEIGDRSRGQGIELSKSVLSDVIESLIAAIYLTEGYPEAYTFVERIMGKYLDIQHISVTVDNYKSLLLEYTQANKLSLPQYRVTEESGPGHNKTFKVAVSIEGRDYGSGSGKNKKQAEQIAAKHAYDSLKTEK